MTDQDSANGITVAGVHVDTGDDHFMDIGRYLTVPEELQDDSEFTSGSPMQIRKLEDHRRRVVVDALIGADDPRVYATVDDLRREVVFRSALLETMDGFQTASCDVDYFIPEQIHPQISGTKVEAGAWQVAQWAPLDSSDVWTPAWRAQSESSPTELLSAASIYPYRGECAGAFQICVFRAAFAALGDSVTDVTQLQIGDWQSPVRTYMEKVPVGSVPIPGDYLYFKNKDDYLELSHGGFWQGLNAMYMETDALGFRRYSGLGAGALSEHNLREYIVNAYTHDCHPHQVDDPETECRFTVQATVKLPDGATTVSAGARETARGRPTPTKDVLTAAGFLAHPDHPSLYRRSAGSLSDVAQGLGFDPAELRQTVSAAAFGTSYEVAIGDARCVVAPADGHGDATHPNTLVVAHVHAADGGDR